MIRTIIKIDENLCNGCGLCAQACHEGAIAIIDGKAKISLDDLVACYEKFTPGATWNCGYYVDLNTGIKKTNHMLVYEDTYVFGKGFLEMTKVKVPDKYLKIK